MLGHLLSCYPQFLLPYYIYLEYKLTQFPFLAQDLLKDLTTIWLHSVVNLLTWILFCFLSAIPSDCTHALAFDPWTMPQCWLTLIIHIAFGVRPEGREGYFRQCHNEYQPNYKEKKKKEKKSRVMGESPEYKPDNLIWKHLFVVKPNFHSLVYTYHTCALMHASFCSFISLGTH